MAQPILAPVVVLAGWTLVVLLWLMARRFPAMKAMGVDLSKARGSRGGDLEGRVEARVQWPAHNYVHLVEQPTLFHAVALVLAMIGQGGGLNAWLAWAYVLIRIVHSIWQIQVNIVQTRFLLFFASTCVLGVLTLRAGIALV